MSSAGGSSDVFVAKYDPAGTLLWAKLFGDENSQVATALSVNANGDIAVTGVFDGTIDFGGGQMTSMGSDIFVAKLDASGNYVWARSFGDAQTQQSIGIAFSGTQNLVVTGFFQSQIDFGNGPLTAVGGAEVFVAKFVVP
ncbi:Hypothetical protein A7982_00150 [Minicystis rosea]|nr:Hypothetical protein A7982_00150 [Minicystis rosea]